MANNREQAHIEKPQSRTELQEYIVERIYENDNEEIDAVDVTESALAIAQSSVNLVDDDVDLRQNGRENFIFSQCTENDGVFEFELAETPIHPDDGTVVLVLEGCVLNYRSDFEVIGNKVRFVVNDDFSLDTQFSISYKFYQVVDR